MIINRVRPNVLGKYMHGYCFVITNLTRTAPVRTLAPRVRSRRVTAWSVRQTKFKCLFSRACSLSRWKKVISWTFIRKIDLAVPPHIFIAMFTAAALNQPKQILSLTPYFLIFRLLGTLVWVLAGSSAVVAFLISSLRMSMYAVPRLCHDRLLRNPSQFVIILIT
jgi:hypothetical protein